MKTNNEDFEIVVECRCCHKEYAILVSEEDFWEWEHGALTQKAFPYLKPSERELLINQTCEACQEVMFPPEPDEDCEEFWSEDYEDFYDIFDDENDDVFLNLFEELGDDQSLSATR